MKRLRLVLDHPVRGYRVLGPLLVVFFLLSGVGGGNDTPASEGLRYRVGATGWATFGVTLVITVVFTVAVIGRSVAQRRTVA